MRRRCARLLFGELAALDVSINAALARAGDEDRKRLAAYAEYLDALRGTLAEARTHSG